MAQKNTNKESKKTIKIEYVIAVILFAIVIVICFSNFSGKNLFQTTKTEKNSNSYELETENKLKEIFSQIDGVGKVEVDITLKNDGKVNVLKTTEKTEQSGKVTLKEQVVYLNGEPYKVSTENPEISGVVVICKGAENLLVKNKITEILTVVYKVSSENIRIIKMK